MSKLSDENDEYIKEGDLILVQVKKQISEVLVQDLSPSGDYMKVSTPAGHHPYWVNCIYHIETLVSAEEDDDTEFVDVEENLLRGEICNAGQEEDLIGDEWKVSIVEPEPAEVITQNTLAEFDKRNQRT